MEFPHLGTHCAEQSCKQLDFLPIKCDACSKIFCTDHVRYDDHKCSESYRKDNQVPVCPLCNKPIPVLPSENADVKVGQHIDTDCQSDPAKERRGKVYTNRCGVKGCKKKELLPMTCDKCRQNFCIRHRHEADHECKGFGGSGRGMSASGAAAVSRNQSSKGGATGSSKPQQTLLQSFGRSLNESRLSRAQGNTQSRPQNARELQNGMTDDEALARAMQMSMAESQNQPKPATNKPLTRQEQEDLDLARALEASEREARRPRRQSSNSDKSCGIS